MKRKVPLLSLLIVFTFTIFNSKAQNTTNVKLYAIQFHADWCGACKKIAPMLNQLKNDYSDNPNVKFVKLDMTNRKTRSESIEKLKKLGYAGLLDKYNGTGYVVLVDAASGKDKGILTRLMTVAQMKSAIESEL